MPTFPPKNRAGAYVIRPGETGTLPIVAGGANSSPLGCGWYLGGLPGAARVTTRSDYSLGYAVSYVLPVYEYMGQPDSPQDYRSTQVSPGTITVSVPDGAEPFSGTVNILINDGYRIVDPSNPPPPLPSDGGNGNFVWTSAVFEWPVYQTFRASFFWGFDGLNFRPAPTLLCGQNVLLGPQAPAAGEMVIDQGVGTVLTGGRPVIGPPNPLLVFPCATTEYTLTATVDPAYQGTPLESGFVDAGGGFGPATAQAKTTIVVLPAPPSLTVDNALPPFPVTNGGVSPAVVTLYQGSPGGFSYGVRDAQAILLTDATGRALDSRAAAQGPAGSPPVTADFFGQGQLYLDWSTGAYSLPITQEAPPPVTQTFRGQWPRGADGGLAGSQTLTLVATKGCCGETSGQIVLSLSGYSPPPRGGDTVSGAAFARDAHARPTFAVMGSPSSSGSGLVRPLWMETTRDAGRSYDSHLVVTAPAGASDPNLLIDGHLNSFRCLYWDGAGLVSVLAGADGERDDWGPPSALGGLSGQYPVTAPHPTDRRTAALLYVSGGSLLSALTYDLGGSWRPNTAPADTNLDFSKSGRAGAAWLREMLFAAYSGPANTLVGRLSPDRGRSWGPARPVGPSAGGAVALPTLISAQAHQGTLYVLTTPGGGGGQGSGPLLLSSGDLGATWASRPAPAGQPPALGLLPDIGRLLLGTGAISDTDGRDWPAVP